MGQNDKFFLLVNLLKNYVFILFVTGMNTKARASDGLNIFKLERVDAMQLPIHEIEILEMM